MGELTGWRAADLGAPESGWWTSSSRWRACSSAAFHIARCTAKPPAQDARKPAVPESRMSRIAFAIVVRDLALVLGMRCDSMRCKDGVGAWGWFVPFVDDWNIDIVLALGRQRVTVRSSLYTTIQTDGTMERWNGGTVDRCRACTDDI